MSPIFSFSPVTKENWNDFVELFESKGAPKHCWCMAFRLTKEELKNNIAEFRKIYIRNRIDSDTPVGIIGYKDTEPIAWCSVGPRETFSGLGGNETLEKVWSITCFYIRREYRKQNLVGSLLENALIYAKRNKAKYVEAYAVLDDSPSYRHMGFMDFYIKNGFTYTKMAGSRRHVMIKELV
jgi:GNAT superfamily N-acetyltransferase